MNRFDLCGQWSLEPVDKTVPSCPCEIPGDIHSALLHASRIPDPYWAMNESTLQYLHWKDWKLTKTFTIDEQSALGFSSIYLSRVDTFADIKLNEVLLGTCGNAFRDYRFPLGNALNTGENELTIILHTAEGEAFRRAENLSYPVPHVIYPMQSYHRNLIRKPQCHAGWDWGPCLMAAGIYGTIELFSDAESRVEYILADTTRQNAVRWFLRVRIGILKGGDTPIPVSAEVKELSVCERWEVQGERGRVESEVTLSCGGIQPWWPNGCGEQKRYALTVEVNGQRVTKLIGFREVFLLNEEDQWGKSMEFTVNGVALFAKGANWIPPDALPSRQTEQRYRMLLGYARDAHMNMIRVWGGGQYEPDMFYELCDELGLLVWQDCMFSCSTYPSDKWFLQEVEEEITFQVRRLQHHPSLALWCGNNENLGALNWFEETRNHRDRYIVDYDRLYEGTIGNIIKRIDPDRPWWPSSPSAGSREYTDCWHDDTRGDMHYWSVWHEGKPIESYREVVPRFCSEFGFQSFSSLQETVSFAPADQWNITSPVMLYHQRNPQGNTIILTTMSRYYRIPTSFPGMLYVSQVQQAAAIQTAVDFWRCSRPRCMGILYWQLNDLWPVASWSSLEYSGRWKLLHYQARRFYEPIHIALIPDGDSVQVYSINDERDPMEGTLRVRLYALSGEIVYQKDETVACREETASCIMKLPSPEEDLAKNNLILRCTLFSLQGELVSEAVHTYVPPRELVLERTHVTVESCDGASSVYISSDKPALYVWVEVPDPVPLVDNGFHLFPGEQVEVALVNGEGFTITEIWHLEKSSRNIYESEEGYAVRTF